MKRLIGLLVFVCLARMGTAFTPAETNEMARAILSGVHERLGGDTLEALAETAGHEALSTWHGFLGGDETNGWTMVAKKAAFNWYLSTLGNMVGNNLNQEEKRLVRTAVLQCRALGYVEAVPALRRLATNPHGIARDIAIETAINLGPVDADACAFVESIMTNQLVFTWQERSTAVGEFAQQLLDLSPTNSVCASNKTTCVNLLYGHRLFDVAGAVMLDDLFVASVAGYANSSNRLEFAQFVLSHPGCRKFQTDEFTVVTNQLLTSGQPLRQLNIGEVGE